MLLDIAHRAQKTEHDCGPTAFRIVCDFLGINGKGVRSDALHGLHPMELEPAFRRLGLTVQAGEMDLDDLKYHAARNRPVVCLVKRDGVGHWVVSRGVRGCYIHLCDPADAEPCKRKCNDFLDGWADYDRTGTIYRHYGIAVGV